MATLILPQQFSALDRHFADLMLRLSTPQPAELHLAAALVSRATALGHVCLELDHPDVAIDGSSPLPCPTLAKWREVLAACSIVGAPGSARPLILDAGRLYLERYWHYETQLAADLLRRAGAELPLPPAERLAKLLDRYFPDADVDCRQRVAALVALSRLLCVITGGPGTGKTTALASVLGVLLESTPGLRIALAAPTGKAAARMQEAVTEARRLRLPADAAAGIPDQASTLHRLLGAQRDSPTFTHGPDNPLPLDVVAVDEASMVDLPLMAKLVAALPAQCRLILLGDRNQLASVEAGAVLGDLCDESAVGSMSRPFAELARRVARADIAQLAVAGDAPGLKDVIVELTRTHRSVPEIAAFSASVRAADAEGALTQARASKVVRWHALPLSDAFRDQVLRGFAPVCRAASPCEALDALAGFRVLCCLRRGRLGVESVNRLIERVLHQAGMLRPAEPFYPGQAIMITRNDYPLALYNGDTGVIWPDPANPRQLQVCFSDGASGVRTLAPSRLPAWETAFALTVHKSQGSEFSDVVLVLPDADAPILTRELVYTGVTRAKKSVEIWGTEEVFEAALGRRVRRSSGLAERLWGEKTES
jgi:exodeoxyribonuclease V alpha subunit